MSQQFNDPFMLGSFLNDSFEWVFFLSTSRHLLVVLMSYLFTHNKPKPAWKHTQQNIVYSLQTLPQTSRAANASKVSWANSQTVDKGHTFWGERDVDTGDWERVVLAGDPIRGHKKSIFFTWSCKHAHGCLLVRKMLCQG